MAGCRTEEPREAKCRFQASSYAYAPCVALVCQGIEAQKVTACKLHLGSTLLIPEKKLALCTQLAYYKSNEVLDRNTGTTGIHACDLSDVRGVRVLVPCRHLLLCSSRLEASFLFPIIKKGR
jgi:hypothetical protein